MEGVQDFRDLYNTICKNSGLDADMWTINMLPKRESVEELKKVIGYMLAQKITSKERALTLNRLREGTGIKSLNSYDFFRGHSYSPSRFGVVKRTEDKRVYVDERRTGKIQYLPFLEALEALCR